MNSSIRSRFGFSLFANFTKSAISFCSGMLVARSLGPDEYGSMMFLLGTFTAMRQLLDMGSSKAFFTFVSQRQRSRKFVGYYGAWLGIQFLLPLLAVGLLLPDPWIDLIWRGEQRSLVLLAFLVAYMQSILWSVILQMGESQRLTRRVQGVALAVAVFHFALMAIGWWGGWLEIRVIFYLMILEWCVAIVIIVKQLEFPIDAEESDSPSVILSEFWHYCLPLIPYAWVGFAYEFTDRWLLQTYAGSTQQAYYSVAYQFGAIAAIATSSILNILWKEIAEAYEQKDTESVALLYQKVLRGLFFIAAAGAGFLAPWSEAILQFTLGTAYIGGAATLTVMFFYPLHQSMGQIGGVLAYATGQVSVFVNIGLVFMLLSIFVTYFVLASPESSVPGLALGSLGLAGKMVVLQILSVNTLAYFLARSLQTKFDWVFQPVAAIICLSAGYLSFTFSRLLIEIDSHLWAAFFTAGLLYLIMLCGFILVFPGIAGLRNSDISSALESGSRLLRL